MLVKKHLVHTLPVKERHLSHVRTRFVFVEADTHERTSCLNAQYFSFLSAVRSIQSLFSSQAVYQE